MKGLKDNIEVFIIISGQLIKGSKSKHLIQGKMTSFTFDKEDILLETVPCVSRGCLSWDEKKG